MLQENIHKTLNSILTLVKQENPQIFEDVIEVFNENQIELDSKLSSIDINSKYSKSLKSSKFGMNSQLSG